MRKILALVAAVAMAAILAIPASAQGPLPCTPTPNGNGAAGCTVQMRDVTFGPFPVPTMTCPDGSVIPGGLLTVTYETAIFHITINAASDFWATSTQEGTFVLLSTSGVTFTGHIAGWFGESVNNQNFVFHSTFNVVATGSDGSHVSFHMVSHLSTSADGTMTLMFDKLIC
jgi:hypothetical protein